MIGLQASNQEQLANGCSLEVIVMGFIIVIAVLVGFEIMLLRGARSFYMRVIHGFIDYNS